MTGLEAISANNGWAMAAVGGSIVFSGLVILSFTISQLHKVLALWDRRHTLFRKKESQAPLKEMPTIQITGDVQEIIRDYKLLTRRIGDPIALPKLLDIAAKCGLARPHSTINMLVTSKIMIPDGKGFYRWNY